MLPEHISDLYAMKGTPHDILIAFIYHRDPMGTKDLAYFTHHTETQVLNGLRLLNDLGMIQRVSRYNGWKLTPQAEQKLRLQPDPAPAPAASNEHETAAGEAGSGTHSLLVPILKEEDLILGSEELTSSSSSDSESQTALKRGPKNRKNGRRSHPGKGKKRRHGPRVPVPAVPRPESAPAGLPAAPGPPDPQGLPENSLPPGPPDLPEISAPRLLAATEDLFGEPVLGRPGGYPDPELLLVWIAQAHAQRHRLKTPARVVYSKLRDGIEPARKYREDPCAFLPASFLREAGLPVPPEAADPPPEEGWPEEDWLDEAGDEPPPGPPPDPSLSLPVAGATREASPGMAGPSLAASTSAGAWASAVGVLRREIPRQSFDLYAAELRLARFDPQACRFTVAAPGENQRRLSESRVGAMLRRILSGICARPAEVEFVVEE